MAEQQKKAKYFCEGCGAEVAHNAKFCPKCGRFFAAVRCPSCGHVGTVRDFIKGCPSCKYAMNSEEVFGSQNTKTLDGRKHKLSKKSKNLIKKAFKDKKHSNLSEDVPTWLFITSVIVLILVFVALFYRCNAV